MAEVRLLEKLLVNNPLYAWLQRWEVVNLHRLTLEGGIGRPVTPVFDIVGVARKAV